MPKKTQPRKTQLINSAGFLNSILIFPERNSKKQLIPHYKLHFRIKRIAKYIHLISRENTKAH